MNTVWLRAALVRALKTAAQTAVAVIGSASLFTEVDWLMIASASGMAAVLSLLTSVAGLPEAPAPLAPARANRPLRAPERGGIDAGSLALGMLLMLAFLWFFWATRSAF